MHRVMSVIIGAALLLTPLAASANPNNSPTRNTAGTVRKVAGFLGDVAKIIVHPGDRIQEFITDQTYPRLEKSDGNRGWIIPFKNVIDVYDRSIGLRIKAVDPNGGGRVTRLRWRLNQGEWHKIGNGQRFVITNRHDGANYLEIDYEISYAGAPSEGLEEPAVFQLNMF